MSPKKLSAKSAGFVMNKLMKSLSIFAALAATVFLCGCRPANSRTTNSDPAPVYAGRGTVLQVSPDRHTATIRHEKIPGYMGAMTMDFTVKDTNELRHISPNDEITFDLVVQTNSSWIEHIQFQTHHVGDSDVTNNTFVFHLQNDELKTGDPLPDGELMSEDGSPVRLSDFRGRVLAFTFFFTSCPLPDYCPRMNRNFTKTRQLLDAETNAAGHWQLLSISFDSGFDKPEILAGYATFYRGQDTNHWLFCTAPTNTLAILAPSLGLMIMRDTNGIAHNLRTVVVDPQGRIFRQFDGNQWTPRELADAVLTAARQTNAVQQSINGPS
jgi:protein SCO1/2